MSVAKSCLPFSKSLLVTVAMLLVGSAVTAAAQDQEKQAAARAFNAAAELQNSGLYDRAIEKWQTFIAKYAKDERIDRGHFYLGICQLQTTKYDDAAKTFQTVVSKWPKFSQADVAQHYVGIAYYQKGHSAGEKPNADDLKKSVTAFQTLVQKFPNSGHSVDALYFQGDLLFKLSDLPGAEKAFATLIQKHPTSSRAARAYYDLGLIQQEQNKPADAAKTFETFLSKAEFKTHELAAEIRLRRALCLFDLQQLAPAVKEFQEIAKAKGPFQDFATLRLGQCQMQLQQYDEAAKSLANFSKSFPKSTYLAMAQLTAGRSYYQLGKYAEAANELQSVASSDDPVASEASYWLGRSQLEAEKPDDALKTLESAVGRFKEGEFASYLQLARIDALYEKPDRRAETAKLYQDFVKSHNDHPLASQAQYMAALSALGQQDFATAKTMSEAFLKNPNLSTDPLTADVLFIAGESYLLADKDHTDAGARGKQTATIDNWYRSFPNIRVRLDHICGSVGSWRSAGSIKTPSTT